MLIHSLRLNVQMCFKGFESLKFLKLNLLISISLQPEAEFKKFEPRLKSPKTRFKLSAGLNLETFDTI